MNNDRLQREKLFHDERFGSSEDTREKLNKYYSLMGTAKIQYKKLIAQYCQNGNILEYGCGSGDRYLLSLGATVSGIDISSEAVRKAKQMAASCGCEAYYGVGNAEETDFDDNSFDMVVGKGILHHLDMAKAYLELSRILKPGGHAVFIEPLGHNPLLNLYRRLTPSMRTEDEHPLKDKDIQLSKRYFAKVEAYYYNLLTLLSVPFRKTNSFESVNNFLSLADSLIFSLPFLKRYAWMVVLHISEPKK